MLPGLIGKKIIQRQGFLEDGTRVPLSVINLAGNVVSQIKGADRDGYHAVQLGFDSKKKTTKPQQGHIQKAGLSKTPRFFREIRVAEASDLASGSEVKIEEVFKAGDVIDVTGVSKGKGFAGVVKRYHFRGGPRTHGQSDRERAPGSIGQTTTPGRVYKGKKMAGHMGHVQVTVKNLEIIEIDGDTISVKGLIPGPIGTVVTVTKVGESKKHKGLYKATTAEEIPANLPVEEIKSSEAPAEVTAPAEEAAEEVTVEAQGETGAESVATPVEGEKDLEEKKEEKENA